MAANYIAQVLNNMHVFFPPKLNKTESSSGAVECI